MTIRGALTATGVLASALSPAIVGYYFGKDAAAAMFGLLFLALIWVPMAMAFSDD